MGSSPIASTSRQVSPYALAGFVAGEGSFVVTPAHPPVRVDGSERLRFVFAVSVARRDRSMLEALHDRFGVGSIKDAAPRKPSWLPMSTYRVSSRLAHRAVTIPFFDEHLLPCAKRRQFDSWRAQFDAYEQAHPTRIGFGPSPCSVEGCERPVRGRGLCRSHYYRATGY